MLIFLDMDGVMIPIKSWKTSENLEDNFPMFKEESTLALKSLISENDTVILTTSHRTRFTIQEWKQIFERRGLKIEKLDILAPQENFDKKRKDGILERLKDSNDNFIIIDDDTTLNALPINLKQHLILTQSMIGLTVDQVGKYIAGRTSG
jgi:UDP-N-acetylglucosamine 2-epimerase